jgi:hypothetical protein
MPNATLFLLDSFSLRRSAIGNVDLNIQERAKLCLLTLHLNQHSHNHCGSCYKYNTTCRYGKPTKTHSHTELIVNNQPICNCDSVCVNTSHHRFVTFLCILFILYCTDRTFWISCCPYACVSVYVYYYNYTYVYTYARLLVQESTSMIDHANRLYDLNSLFMSWGYCESTL